MVNPASRRGGRWRVAAEGLLRVAGLACEVVVTSHPGDALALVRQAGPAYDAVFVLGGDGTVMEVASALAGTGVPVGVLPGGTGNLVAGALGIPGNVERAIAALVHGRIRRIDLGRLRGDGGGAWRHFVFGAGIGLDVAMVAGTSTARKRHLGVLGYTLTAARGALALERFAVTLAVDGETHRADAVMVMAVNAGSLFGGLVRLGPGIAPDDGLLDVCVFSPASVVDVLALAGRVLAGDFAADPRLWYRKARRVRFETVPSRPVQADGDIVAATPVDIEVEPGAATFLVPA